MSYRTRQSAMSSLFGSNHFVIAACAAIAMVLGAMSVGASVSDSETSQQASISSTTISTGSGATRLPHTDEKSSGLTPQHTLEPQLLLQPHKATAEKLKGAAKVQYQLNELLTPVASSLFVDQTSLLNELQAKVNTGALNTAITSNITPLTDTTSTSGDGSTTTPDSGAPVTVTNPAPPTEEPVITSPQNPDENSNPSIFSSDIADPLLTPPKP